MQLSPGKLVVHPHHGPAAVTNRTQRTVKGAEVTYIELTVRSSGLVVSIPESRVEEVGIREVYDRAHLRKLLEVVQESSGVEEKQWSRRMKANQEKVASGMLEQIAEVVRDLGRRRDTKGLSMAEKDLFRSAQVPLAAEVGLALGITEDEAVEVIDAVANGASLDELGFAEDASDSEPAMA
ncbi:CarD family transcriptional regulator [Citricoccus sp. GCM10030269]|uniref:CarD family transcriptional regulator n=1 Tax=Citricoccus sp. GCM10030269 TaxID=3273388 RepID=UPI00360F8AB3